MNVSYFEGDNKLLLNKFTSPKLLFIITNHDETYSSKIMKENLKTTCLDFFVKNALLYGCLSVFCFGTFPQETWYFRILN